MLIVLYLAIWLQFCSEVRKILGSGPTRRNPIRRNPNPKPQP